MTALAPQRPGSRTLPALPREGERLLALGVLALPLLSASLLAALAATFAGPVERALAERFASARAVPVFRWELLALAAALLVPWLLRARVLALARGALADYARFDAAAAPAPAQVSGAARVLLAAAGLLAGALGSVALLLPAAYRALIEEDGVLESGSALCWLLAAAGLAAAWSRRRAPAPAGHLAYGLLLLFFLVCGGEEISWGQRILGFQGPDVLLEINKQGETNLHNIGSISLFANAIFAFALGFFLILPRLQARHAAPAAYARHLGLPRLHPALPRLFVFALMAWGVVGLRYGTLGFHPFSLWGHYSQMDDELFEFFLAFAFASFALLDLAEARKARRQPVPPPRFL